MLARRTESSRPRLAVALSAVTLVALTAAPALAGALPTADELIDKSTKAMGGKAVEKIESYMATAETVAPMGTMTSEIYWAKPNLVFAKQSMPPAGETRMGTDGEIAWVHNEMMGGYSLLEGSQRDQLIEQAIHIRLMRFRETAKDKLDFKAVTEADFDGAKCFELAFVGAEDKTEEGSIFFDADSGLIRGMRVTDNGQPATVLLKDWKAIDGVRFFHKMDMSSGPMTFTINYTKIEVNKVDPSVFAVPAEVKELAKKQADRSGDDEIKVEDLSPQAQAMVKGFMDGLPWDNLPALEQARASIARQADSTPGDFGKGMKYVLGRIDAALAGGG